MKLSIRGPSNALTRREQKFAAHWFSKLLFSNNLFDKLFIQIHNTSLKQYKGLTEPSVDCPYPKEFLITIDNKSSRRLQLKTLAHELAHVKQYAKNELRDQVRISGRIKWNWANNGDCRYVMGACR